jgi:hypothetical protein
MRYSGVRREIAKIRKILNETCGLNYLSVKDANFMLNKICEALVVDEKSNGWIPVSERLPEDEKECLVTLEKVHGTPETLFGIANYLKLVMPDTGMKRNMGILNGINIQMGMEE